MCRVCAMYLRLIRKTSYNLPPLAARSQYASHNTVWDSHGVRGSVDDARKILTRSRISLTA